jgi:hypothetical protein
MRKKSGQRSLSYCHVLASNMTNNAYLTLCLFGLSLAERQLFTSLTYKTSLFVASRLAGSRWKYSTPPPHGSLSHSLVPPVVFKITPLRGSHGKHSQYCCLCVFTEALLRIGSHNAVILLLIGADRTENTVSFYCYNYPVAECLSSRCLAML